ncbi:MAG: flap endonuclease-1 [Candidatus Bathyarchaeota archaeon]|nr:MAG: flap endonuclease-1 [Candidatus Bathyarchaeota archaeon]
MGVNLRPLIIKNIIRLENLRAKSLAVDANNMLYQFLSLIRTPDGTPLKDSSGRTTSHLLGLMFRSTRLIHDYHINLVFVFDGKPPLLKEREIAKRRKLREKATKEWKKALETTDYATAFSKAVMTSRLTKPLVDDAKRLLRLLGIPFLQAPSEAEAQASYMTMRGDVWASSSRDYDSLLFGAPRLVRYLTISGKEFLPSKGVSRPLKPELVDLRKLLFHHKLTREKLIDLAILIGTDFNDGVKGIGTKTALKLVKKYGNIEHLPSSIRSKVSEHYDEVRRIFLRPNVTSDYTVRYGKLHREKLHHFLCDERDISEMRVEIVAQRMKEFHSARTQTGLEKWVHMPD